jgi:hypothetical protein
MVAYCPPDLQINFLAKIVIAMELPAWGWRKPVYLLELGYKVVKRKDLARPASVFVLMRCRRVFGFCFHVQTPIYEDSGCAEIDCKWARSESCLDLIRCRGSLAAGS